MERLVNGVIYAMFGELKLACHLQVMLQLDILEDICLV